MKVSENYQQLVAQIDIKGVRAIDRNKAARQRRKISHQSDDGDHRSHYENRGRIQGTPPLDPPRSSGVTAN